MRIKTADQTNHPVPKFIVIAESPEDRAVLKMFSWYLNHGEVEFALHSFCHTDGQAAFV